MMNYQHQLRPYQKEAATAAVDFFNSNIKGNAIEVLPTGSGKSLVIAKIAEELNEPVLVFQPTKEILEQNYQKFLAYEGEQNVGIYSASVGRKEIRPVTFATIGSVIRKSDILSIFKHIIVDECHYVNAKGGMYRDLFQELGNVKIIGLTATPYRLVTDGFGGSILKFLTRTRPRVFQHVIYFVQNKDLFDEGYLAKLRYVVKNDFEKSRLKLNTTGADYTDESVKRYYKKINFRDRVAQISLDLSEKRKSVLVFTRFIAESEYVVEKIPGAVIVTGKTQKRDRTNIINGFKTGQIPVVCNVGVLTHGFDYPELDTIVIARPTMSLALYYQMIGRGIRIHPDKEHALIVDACDNFRMFGPIENLRMIDTGNGKWIISSNGRQLTNIYYGDKVGYHNSP